MLDRPRKQAPKGEDRKKAQRLTRPQSYELINALMAVCKKEGEYAKYDEGWSDARLATEFGQKFGFTIADGTVAVIRRDFIGGFAPAPPPSVTRAVVLHEVAAKLAALEDRFARRFPNGDHYPLPLPNSTLGESLALKVEGMDRRLLAMEQFLEELAKWAKARETEPFTRALADMLKDWEA